MAPRGVLFPYSAPRGAILHSIFYRLEVISLSIARLLSLTERRFLRKGSQNVFQKVVFQRYSIQGALHPDFSESSNVPWNRGESARKPCISWKRRDFSGNPSRIPTPGRVKEEIPGRKCSEMAKKHEFKVFPCFSRVSQPPGQAVRNWRFPGPRGPGNTRISRVSSVSWCFPGGRAKPRCL